MASKTWFATNTLVSNHQQLSETSPGANATSSPATGWVVGTTAPTVYSEFDGGTKQANGTFSGTVRPDGSINTAGDCLRTNTTYRGTFANANWTLTFSVIGVTNSGAQDGRARFRLFRSVNADGSSATEITAAAQVGSNVVNLSTTQQDSSVTFNPGALSLVDEYLFVQVGWEIQGAGGMSTTDVVMRIGDTGTRVVSSNFTNDYAVTAGNVSFTETGNAAGLLFGRLTAAATGTFTETGNAAILAKGKTMPAATGAFTETGNASGLLWTHVLPAGSGAFTLTGVEPVLDRGMPAGVGAFAFTGNAATLTYTPGGGDPILTAATGTFTETGNVAGLLVGHLLTAAAAAFTETGNAAGLLVGHRLAADTSSFALTGAAPILDRGMPAAVGMFALTGRPAGFLIGHSLSATTGAFAETGGGAGLLLGRRLAAAAGVFAETGNAVAFPRGKGMQAAGGAFTLGASSAALLRSHIYQVAPGVFVLYGASATFNQSGGTDTGPAIHGPDALQVGTAIPSIPLGISLDRRPEGFSIGD